MNDSGLIGGSPLLATVRTMPVVWQVENAWQANNNLLYILDDCDKSISSVRNISLPIRVVRLLACVRNVCN